MPIAIYVLALAAFSVGTAEFIVAGLLPPLAADLGVTIPVAGLLVTGYGATVAVASPVIAALTARLPRRTMLIGVLLVFALGQAVCAVAANYGLLLVARIAVASAHGVFFGVSLVIIGSMVRPEKSGSAYSLFFAGLTLAVILGVPGGTAIGTAFGWRTAFWFVGVISTLATVAVLVFIPRSGIDGEGQTALGPQLRQLMKQEIFLSYLMIALAALGFFMFVTYQVPLLREVTGVPEAQVPIYLFIAGSGSVAGSFIGGRLANSPRLMPALVAVMVCQAVVMLVISLVAATAVAIGAAMIVLGVLFGSFATPIQARIAAAARDAPALATTLISTAFNIGIAAGALLGSIVLANGAGYALLPAMGTALCLLAAGVGVLSWRLDARAVR